MNKLIQEINDAAALFRAAGPTVQNMTKAFERMAKACGCANYAVSSLHFELSDGERQRWERAVDRAWIMLRAKALRLPL